MIEIGIGVGFRLGVEVVGVGFGLVLGCGVRSAGFDRDKSEM